jgi:raffinose/stachyose/melibiose transport system substrate-binding protein
MSHQRRLTLGCFLALILLLTTQCGQTTSTPAADTTSAPEAAAPTTAPEAAEPTEAAPAEEATEAPAEEAPAEEATEAPAEEATEAPAEETAMAETATTAGGGESGAAAGETTVPELTWQGTITFYSQAYTPNSTQEGADQLTAFQTIADEYQALHPGITIQFIDEDTPEYDTVVRTKAAAGELWDIFWAQWGLLNGNYPEGIAVDLNPFFDQPNPYIPGNQRWADAMNETVLNETIAPSGARYNINGDFVGTAFYYNKDLFEQAGITEPPSTWPELVQVAQQLKDAGITPMSQFPSYGWFQRHFLTDFYSPDFDTIQNFDDAPAISPLDEAVAMQKGILSTKDPRFMAWWPIFKQLTDTWAPDYLTQTGEEAGDPSLQDFTGGRTAIFYSGSWTGNNIRTAGAEFEWGTFNFPVLDKSVSEYAQGISTAGQVGGPNAAYQYAISTPKANKTMEEPGKPEAVLDFLRFIGTPRAVESIVNEKGSFIPTWPDTTPSAGNEVIVEQAKEGLKSVWVGNSVPDLDPSIQRTFGLYLSGNISIEEATAEVQGYLDKAVADYAATNGVDYSQYE